MPRAGACVSEFDCADSDPCNGIETCTAGTCQPGTPVDCDRQDDFCTDWHCANYGGFAYCLPTTKTPPTCDDGNACNGYETYSCATGQCVAGTPYDCDQYDDFCYDYACASFGGSARCVLVNQTPPRTDCDDGDACNGYESFSCQTGQCVGTAPVFCPPGTHCVSSSNSPSCVSNT